MKVLAIEFSSAQRSLAVAVSGTGIAPALLAEEVETGGRAANTFAMAERVLDEAGLQREEIECIAIGIGPGSYTGIRAAIAAAQGWQFARDIKLLAISSADCLAADAIEKGLRGRAAVVIDAQRGEFYLAEYALEKSYEMTSALRIVSLEELDRVRNFVEHMVGPDNPFESLAAAGKDLGIARNFTPIFPRAGTLAQLALTRTDFIQGHAMEPIYLRETTFVKSPPSRPAT